MKRVFVGWPVWTPSPEGVRCVLGAEETLGSEARDVKSKQGALPSGGPRDPPRRSQKPRPEAGRHSWITAYSAVLARVLSYLAAQLKDPLRLGGHHHGCAHRCYWRTRRRHRRTRRRHRVRGAVTGYAASNPGQAPARGRAAAGRFQRDPVMFVTYLGREPYRRMRQAVFAALGLIVGGFGSWRAARLRPAATPARSSSAAQRSSPAAQPPSDSVCRGCDDHDT